MSDVFVNLQKNSQATQSAQYLNY